MPEHRPGCPATRTLAIGACTCGEPAHDDLCPFLVARLVCHCDTIAKVRADTAERIAAIERERDSVRTHLAPQWTFCEDPGCPCRALRSVASDG